MSSLIAEARSPLNVEGIIHFPGIGNTFNYKELLKRYQPVFEGDAVVIIVFEDNTMVRAETFGFLVLSILGSHQHPIREVLRIPLRIWDSKPMREIVSKVIIPDLRGPI